MEAKELFEKVYIKSEADLPKKEGDYYWHWETQPLNDVVFKHYYPDNSDYWMAFDWYFRPVAPVEANKKTADEWLKDNGYNPELLYPHETVVKILNSFHAQQSTLPTDEEIETWAEEKSCVRFGFSKGAGIFDNNRKTDLIEGAKAMRDGKIK